MPEPRVYGIRHTTRYFYSTPVYNSAMTLCFKPRDESGQSLVTFDVNSEPSTLLTHETDYLGNTKHYLILHQQHGSLEINAISTVEVHAKALAAATLDEGAWAEIEGRRDSIGDWGFTHPSKFARPSPELDNFVSGCGLEIPHGDPLSALIELSGKLHETFEYVPGSTSAVSQIEEILKSKKGVCQDYVHVMITIARGWGIPARYVSGYLYVEDDDGNPIPSVAGHAWVECRLPGLGWVGFDPTNNSLTGQQHVRVAVGRDYDDVAPTRGIFRGGGETRLEVEVGMELVSGAS